MFKLAKKEHLIVPAHIHHLGTLRDFVSQLGQKYNFSYKFVNAFKLAVDEAATNIIKHAYAEENEGYITIQAIIKQNSLTIKLIDQGAYFDPKWAKSPNIRSEIERGNKAELGIFMMRKLLDKIDYQKTEAGNELSLTKVQKPEPKKPGLHRLASLPTAIKVKYFVHTTALVTLLLLAGFAYYYQKVDDNMKAEYIVSGKTTGKQIASQISAVKPNLLSGPDGISYINAIMFPVFDERLGQIYSLSIENNSGDIVWSTIPHEVFTPFHRPGTIYQIEDGVFSYFINDSLAVYEFEKALTFEEPNNYYSTVHVILAKSYLDNQIHLKRLYYIKITLIVLGLSYILLAVLSYLIVHPVRKLATWVKAVNQGESEDMDIDTSSEIGEIAQAFNDINKKFKESQKNLVGKERLEKQAQVAKDIQSSLLPDKVPESEQYEIEAYYEAAQVVGGDYYDFIEVDKDTLGIVIADVSGKGVPGSLVMTMFRTALRTEARGIKDAAEVLTRVNDYVMNDLKNGMFVTVFYLIFDLKKNLLNFASAGHTPLILYQSGSKKTFYLKPIGFPIGIQLPEKNFFNRNIQSETIQLCANDTLLLYTDGVIEAMNPKKELYGEKRLLKHIRRYGHLSLSAFSDKLKTSIFSFTEGSTQSDDITFVVVRQKQIQHNGDEQEFNQNLTAETKFLSIEEVEKLLEVIRIFPDFEPTEMAEELNTKCFEFTKIEASRIRTELLRKRLHTKELRQAYAISCHKDQTKEARLNSEMVIKKQTGKEKNGRQKVRQQDLPEQALPNDFAPEIEADFVVGDFVDDLLKKDKPSKQEGQEKHDLSKTERNHSETPLRDFKNEDISDSLIDSLLTNYFPETKTKTEEPEKPRKAEKRKKKRVSEKISTKKEDAELREESEIETEELPASPTELPQDSVSLKDISLGFELPQIAAPRDIQEPDPESDKDSEIIPEQDADNVSKAASAPEKRPEQIEDDFKPEDIQEAAADEDVQIQTEEIHVQHELDSDSVESDSPERNKSAMTDQKDDHLTDIQKIFSDAESIFVDQRPDVFDASTIQEAEQDSEHPAESPFPAGTPEEDAVSEIEETPNLADILMDGILNYKDQQYEDAIIAFKKVLKIDPDYQDVYSLLGNAYFRNDMLTEALSTYEQLKRKFPEDASVSENLGSIYAKMGVFQLAVKEWKNLLKAQPERKDIEAKVQRALAIIHADQDAPTSYRPPVSAFHKPSDSIPTHELSQEDEAHTHPGNGNGRARKSELLRAGINLYQNHNFEAAIQKFKNVIEMAPESTEAYRYLANAYFRNNMLEEAAQAYRKLSELDSGDFAVHENMGLIYAKQGSFQEAIEEWRKILEAHPERTDLQDRIDKVSQLV